MENAVRHFVHVHYDCGNAGTACAGDLRAAGGTIGCGGSGYGNPYRRSIGNEVCDTQPAAGALPGRAQY